MTPIAPKHRRAILALGLLLSAGLAWLGQNDPPADALAIPVLHGKQSSNAVAETSEALGKLEIMHTPISRQSLFPQSKQPPKDLFSPGSWNPPPLPPPPQAIEAQPPMPPAPPPLPFSYLGKKWEAGKWEVYLSNGPDQLHIARAGDILETQYRIDKIDPPTIVMTYLPLGQPQALPIGEPQ